MATLKYLKCNSC